MMFSFKYVLILFLCYPASTSESKTSSECWACRPNTPHVLTCNGGGVIVIQGAYYGYNRDCPGGITTGAGCTVGATKRCCKPGGADMDCFKSFNIRDGEELETKCSSEFTCTFNSIRHDQPHTCNSITFTKNSFTLINYTCQDSEKGNEGNGGTAAGISIGVILSIGVAVAVVFFAIRRRKQQKDETATTTTSYQRKESNATNTANLTPTINAARNTPSSSNDELGRYMMTNGKKPQTELNSTNVGNYYQIDDSVMTSRNQSQTEFQAGNTDDYHQIEDSDFIQNKLHDGYTHVGITNAALCEDDYRHIGGDNSNNIAATDDAYNHINNADIQLDKDDYHHIDVNTTQETVDVEYNHIGPDSQTDNYGYNHFGGIKPEVNGHDDYNHIGKV